MPQDDDFSLWLGRIGSDGGREMRAGKMLARARRMRSQATARGRRFTGARLGRGSGVGRMLGSSDRHAGFRSRRVVVKTRIVRLGGKKSGAAAAHLRYLQRDGTTREGERGTLYGAEADRVDGKAFLERGAKDRHQFRFIVAPEDGAEYEDLKPLTRRLMQQVEQDLGTKLDWVAVDHFNTGHPHSHVIVRGKDDRGKDLIIARGYLTQGLRMRAAELVNLDLGPRTDHEIEQARAREVEQERFTSIDRRLLRDADEAGRLDPAHRSPREHALRIGRLRVLERLELASQGKDGTWTLAPELEATLLRVGERGDIIKTLHREMREANIHRMAQSYSIYDSTRSAPISGRVVAIGLADEHRDRRYVIIDGIDGQSHYADIGHLDDTPVSGSIVSLSARPVAIRNADRTVAKVAAANEGRYSIDAHLNHDPLAREEMAEANVRRLEAMRRATGKPERESDGTWIIGKDHLQTAERYERQLSSRLPVVIETLSRKPLEMLPGHDGETWLDREIVAGHPAPSSGGFGVDVRKAMTVRRQWLIEQQLAEDKGTTTLYRAGMLRELRRRELDRTIRKLEAETGSRHVIPHEGERIEGTYRRAIEVGDRKFALIENSREFSLVPWRPVLERAVGKEVSGIVRKQGISWTIGRQRSLSIGM